jgi:tetratricopeptide (TPR) repeat protein
MPEPTGSEARLQSLRRRWETEKSTALLPHAEEYRRLGRLREAIDVLETGLKGNPSYTSGLVALGRCRLESGDSAGAAGVLERVVAQDPEQMVASKLLIEAYLRTGRAREARRRLDIYSTLNAKDPEIARLADRLQAMAHPAPPPAVATPSVAAPAEVEPPPVVAAEEIEMAPVALRETEQMPELEPVSRSPAPVDAPIAMAPADSLLFRGLDGPVAVSRYVRGLVSEGVFRLMFPTAAPAPAAAAAMEPVVAFEPVVVEEEPPPSVEIAEPMSDAVSEDRAAAPVLEVAAESEPELDVAAELEPEPPAVEVAGYSEPLLEPFEADVERAISGFVPVVPPAMGTAPAAIEPSAAELAPPATEMAAPIESPPPPTSGPAVGETATLAELYLQQGHAADAERIFGAVLGREPQNDGARRGLGEAREQLRQTGGLSARRASALRDYLRRLTRREERHVP